MRHKSDEELLRDIQKLNLPKARPNQHRSGVILAKERRGQTENEVSPVKENNNIPRRRLEDFIMPADPLIKRRIVTWSFLNGFPVFGFFQWTRSLLTLLNPNISILVKPGFIRELTTPYELPMEGRLPSLPRIFSLLDEHCTNLLGGTDPASEKMIATRLTESGWPYAVHFLNQFRSTSDSLQKNLALLYKCYESGHPIRVNQLAWAVRGVYRADFQRSVLTGSQIQKLLEAAIKSHMTEGREEKRDELRESALIVEKMLLSIEIWARKLYPAMLFMIGEFFEYNDQSQKKRLAIMRFLDLNEGDLPSPKEFLKEFRKRQEIQERRELDQQVEALEKEKENSFFDIFQHGIETLKTLLPHSGIGNPEHRYMIPYFFYLYQSSGEIPPEARWFHSEDPVRILLIFHSLIGDILQNLNPTQMEIILDLPKTATGWIQLQTNWIRIREELFTPYMKALDEIARRTGTEDDLKLFDERYRKIYDERLESLRGEMISGKRKPTNSKTGSFAYKGPTIFETAKEARQMTEQLYRDWTSQLPEKPRDWEPPRNQQPYWIVSMADLDGNKYPFMRQVIRFAEKRFQGNLRNNPIKSQILTIEILKDLCQIYDYLTNDNSSFINRPVPKRLIAGDLETTFWDNTQKDGIGNLAVKLTNDNEKFLDPLTGIYNRLFLEPEGEKRFKKDSGKGTFSVTMIDIDHFKKFNDTWGHQVGDEVLRRVAQTLSEQIRDGDLAGRYGGEEFTILVQADETKALLETERLRAAVEALSIPGPDPDTPLKVTISAGTAPARGYKSFKETLGAADKALYESKSKGRNRATLIQEGKSFISYEELKNGT